MTQINAYLHFNGNCREAMLFYQECLGGDLTMQTIGETPMAAQMAETVHSHILHSSLTKGGMVFMASDILGPQGRINGNVISLTLICKTESELNTFFSKLSVGGEVNFPVSEQFWGAVYGELTDKFGINWMLNFDKNA